MHDLPQRLRDAVTSPLDAERTELHVASVRRAAVAAGGVATTATRRWRPRGWSRRLVPVAVAASLVTPGLAVAAESSLPGDVLHPVKTVTERLRTVADPSVVARHRLEELAALLEREDVEPEGLREALAAAEDAVAGLRTAAPDEAAVAQQRLVVLRAAVERRLGTTPGGAGLPDDGARDLEGGGTSQPSAPAPDDEPDDDEPAGDADTADLEDEHEEVDEGHDEAGDEEDVSDDDPADDDRAEVGDDEDHDDEVGDDEVDDEVAGAADDDLDDVDDDGDDGDVED